jgi:hypothetical protein
MAALTDLALLGVLLACPALCGGTAVVAYLFPRFRHVRRHDAGRSDPACPFCSIPKSVLVSKREKTLK